MSGAENRVFRAPWVKREGRELAEARRRLEAKTDRSHAYLYKTAAWRKLRLAVLAEAPLCVECFARGSVVDHVKPHRGDASLFFDRANLQTMCARCHSRKTAQTDNLGFRRGRGGKTEGGDI